MHASVEGDPLPEIMFHETRSEYLPEILTQGLEPRDTTQHHYSQIAGSLNGNAGVEAVYLTASSAHGWWGDVVVEVDVAGLPVERDPVLNRHGAHDRGPNHAYRTRERIAPSRIRHVRSLTPGPEWGDEVPF